MWLDALYAYLHYTAVFMLFAFLAVEIYLVRLRLDATTIRQLARVDAWFGASSGLVLATGLLRLFAGAKGSEFYLGNWVIYVKVGLFIAVGLLSIVPTIQFIRWRKALDRDPAFQAPEADRNRMRGYLMLEIHLAAMIPVFAVVMARGLGH